MDKKTWEKAMESFLEMWVETLERQSEAWRNALQMTKQYSESWKNWLSTAQKNIVTEQMLGMAARFESVIQSVLEMVNYYEEAGKKMMKEFKSRFGSVKTR